MKSYADLIAIRDCEDATEAERKAAEEAICRMWEPSPIAEAAFMALFDGDPDRRLA